MENSTHLARVTPDTALQKAKNFLKINEAQKALDHLEKLLGSKRHRSWVKTHEKIMLLYIEHAVNLRKSMRFVFIQYRMIASKHGPSMAAITRFFRDLVEKKAAEAKAEAVKAGDAVDNVELEETPESIMLKAVSGEDAKARKDRKILVPWLKYVWESYRTILDTLKSNGELQELYHETARHAFAFCREHKRQNELRKLADLLRHHRSSIANAKYNHSDPVDLSSVETRALYRTTRFHQLKAASELKMWTEAFDTISDIKKDGFDDQTIGSEKFRILYFHRLSEIFWASKNYHLHAYSLGECYSLSSSTNAYTEEEKCRMASAVVLSVLAIPAKKKSAAAEVFDQQNENNLRVIEMLTFGTEAVEIPTREHLMETIKQRNLIDAALPSVKKIYHLLEKSFMPLKLSAQLEKEFKQLSEEGNKGKNAEEEKKIKMAEEKKDDDGQAVGEPRQDTDVEPSDLERYSNPLKKLALLRLIQQLSNIYKSVRLDHFYDLIPAGISKYEVERFIMKGIRDGLLSLRLDHQERIIYFMERDIESGHVKHQLRNLALALRKVVRIIRPDDPQTQAQTRINFFKACLDGAQQEHADVVTRRELIYNLKKRREKEREDRRVAKERKQQQEKVLQKQLEKDKLKEFEDRRKKKKDEDELEETRKKEAKKKQEQVRAERKIEAEKKKLLYARKLLDYATRATRCEEQKKLGTHVENMMKERVERITKTYEEDEASRKRIWDNKKQNKVRLSKIKQHIDKVRGDIEGDEKEMVKKQRETLEKKVENARSKREDIDRALQEENKKLDELDEEIERLRNQLQEKQEMLAEAKAEAEAKAREEERKEEEQRKAKEDELRREKEAVEKERLRKLDEIEQKKRKKEAELEEKERKKREDRSKGPDRARPGTRDWDGLRKDRDRTDRYRPGGFRDRDSGDSGDRYRPGGFSRDRGDRDSADRPGKYRPGGFSSSRGETSGERGAWRSQRRESGFGGRGNMGDERGGTAGGGSSRFPRNDRYRDGASSRFQRSGDRDRDNDRFGSSGSSGGSSRFSARGENRGSRFNSSEARRGGEDRQDRWRRPAAAEKKSDPSASANNDDDGFQDAPGRRRTRKNKS